MQLSIIIPCYNMGKYLVRCLQSIVNENLTDFEVVCVNDGSTDNTIEVFNRFKYTDEGQDRYPWLHMISQENRGVSSARNSGISHAKGEYLSFVDPDDEIIEGGHRRLLELTEEYNNPDLVVGTMVVIRENGEKRLNNPGNGYWSGGDSLGDAYLRLKGVALECTMSSKLYRAEVIKENGLELSTEIPYGEDACFNAKLFKHLKSIVASDVEVYLYRFNGVSASSRFKGERYIDGVKEMNRLWTDTIKSVVKGDKLSNALNDEYEREAYVWMGMIYMVYRDKSTKNRYSWLKKICRIAHDENPHWRQYFRFGLPKWVSRSMSLGLPVTHCMLIVGAKIPAVRRRFR